ncbi:MAG TPA: hypothetical protein VF669_22985 [Tepidisphaeraceae bacterium]|jgi:hypothetical protein
MIRCLLSIFIISSAALCVVTTTFWIRSYWRADGASYVWQRGPSIHATRSVSSELGRVTYHYALFSLSSEMGGSFSYGSRRNPTGGDFELIVDWGQQRWGFGYLFVEEMSPMCMQRESIGGDWFYSAPHWALAMVFGTGPMAWGTAVMRRRTRSKVGLCEICGYDLRASPDRCPECGVAIALQKVD